MQGHYMSAVLSQLPVESVALYECGVFDSYLSPEAHYSCQPGYIAE